MIGFFNTSTTFSLAALEILQSNANTLYTASNIYSLPLESAKIDVTDQSSLDAVTSGLVAVLGDGSDESTKMQNIMDDVNVTNMFIPSGYTILCTNLFINAHTETIYGGGTLKQKFVSATYPYGIFQNRTLSNTHLLIDGLTLEAAAVTYTNGHYGMYMSSQSIKNVEIRNCHFKGNSLSSANGVTLYCRGESMGETGTRDVWIHNNSFTDISRFGVEIINNNSGGATPALLLAQKQDLYVGYDIRVYNNHFNFSGASGAGGAWERCAVSFASMWGYNFIYNNKIEYTRWGIELNNANNQEIFNNEMTNIDREVFSITTLTTPEYTDGRNYIHHNHIDAEYAFIQLSKLKGTDGLNEFEENYIKTMFAQSDGYGANVHHNTLLKDSTIQVEPANGTFWNAQCFRLANINSQVNNNDVYFTGTEIRDALGVVSSAGTSTSVSDNTIHCISTQPCVTSPTTAITTGNSCEQNYSMLIPSSRDGAGLSNPLDIGQQ